MLFHTPFWSRKFLFKRNKRKSWFGFWYFLIVIVFILILNLDVVKADIPRKINYQSRLRDKNGNAITSSTTIQFSIYNDQNLGAPSDAAAEAGPLLWKETYDGSSNDCAKISPDADGYFSIELGTCNALPDYLDFTQPLYLGVKIDTDNEATPRKLINSFPYALNSQKLQGYEPGTSANNLLVLGSQGQLSINSFAEGFTYLQFSSTTAPNTPIDGQMFYSSVSNTLYARINGEWVDLGGSAAGNRISQDDSNVTVTDLGNGQITFTVDGAEQMRIANNGNVGIGTTNPSEKLVIGKDLGNFGMEPAFVVGSSGGNAGYVIGQDSTHVFGMRWIYNDDPTKAYSIFNTYGYNNPMYFDGSKVAFQAFSGGNFGVGYKDPQTKLQVAGSIGIIAAPSAEMENNKAFVIGDAGTGFRQDGVGELEIWTNNSEKVHVTAGGNFGIGTDTPSEKLVIGKDLGDFGMEPAFVVGSNGGNAGYVIGQDRTHVFAMRWIYNDDPTLAYSIFSTYGYKNPMYFDASEIAFNALAPLNGVNANVGIGVRHPSAKLHITSGNIAFGDDAAPTAEMDNGYAFTIGDSGTGFRQDGTGVLEVWTDNTERIHITAFGNVGIGTDSPSEKLVVGTDLGAFGFEPAIVIGNDADVSGFVIGQASTNNLNIRWIYNATSDNAFASIGTYGYNNDIRFDAKTLILQSASGGKVGIGTTSPAYDLDINGSLRAQNYYSADGTAGISVTVTVKGSDGNDCNLTYKNGLLTASTCP